MLQCSSDVCQLRLDFVKFELNNPPSGQGTTSAGDCSTSGDHLSVTQATGGRKRFGYICGTNTGQHSNYLPLTNFKMDDCNLQFFFSVS